MLRKLGKLGLLGILGGLVFNLITAPAKAVGSSGGVQWFRHATSGFAKGGCYEFTLNEQFIAGAIQGETGPACGFSIEVKPSGEWVHTGGYFNTPPYAWGENKFYSTANRNFSFTCSQPTFSLDEPLPSFITLEREEDLPGAAGAPSSKKYFFSVSDNISLGRLSSSDTFNLDFSFSSNCFMRRRENQQFINMTPVENNHGQGFCKNLSEVEINPRQKSLSLPVTIRGDCREPTSAPSPTPTQKPPLQCGEPCNPRQAGECPLECPFCPIDNPVCQTAPTPTLEPTSAPSPTARPTATPRPTNTPIPTNTPVVPPPTSTPVPGPAPCHCDSITFLSPSDPANIKKGDTITVKTRAYVEDPQSAQVRYMVYKLTLNGKAVDAPNAKVDAISVSGKPGYYETTWSYTVPNSDSALGLYRVDAEIHCAWKTQAQVESLSVNIAGVQDNREKVREFGAFRVFWEFVKGLFTGESGTQTNELEEGPYPTTTAGEGMSLKLGTFYPAPTLPAGGCTYIYFQVVR